MRDEGVKRREIARPLDYTHRGVASGFLPGPTGKSRSSAPVQMLRDSGVAEAVQTRAGTPGLGHGHGIRNTLLPVGMPGTTSGAKRLPVTPTARSGKGRGNLAFFSRAKETWRCGRPGYRPGWGEAGREGWVSASAQRRRWGTGERSPPQTAGPKADGPTRGPARRQPRGGAATAGRFSAPERTKPPEAPGGQPRPGKAISPFQFAIHGTLRWPRGMWVTRPFGLKCNHRPA